MSATRNAHSLPGTKLRIVGLNWQFISAGGVLLFVGYIALTPLIYLLYQTFLTPQMQGRGGTFTLDNYARVFSDRGTLELLSNSVIFAFGVCLVALAVGTGLAWVNERTNTPWKELSYGLALVPLIIPGILFAIAWIFLLSPKIGMVNTFLMSLFQIKTAPFNVYTIWGMIWVQGLHLSPMAFLLLSSTFRSMDPSLEESAMMSGAGLLRTVYNITLRLNLPAVLAIVLITFVQGLESFEVPAIIGVPGGVQVFTSRIYDATHTYPADYGLAGAYSVVLLVLTSLGVYLNSVFTRESQKFSTVTGKGFRPRVMDLGRWKYVTLAGVLAYFVVVVVLPTLVLFWASLNPFFSLPSIEALPKLSFANYKYVIEYPMVGRSLRNSIILAVGSGAIVMLATSVVAWLVVKGKAKGRWLLDNLAFMPMLFPGIVLGAALMFVYLRLPIPIYGTIFILLVAYVTRYLPYGMRYSSAAMIQIHRELEESAQASGASWMQMFLRITLPLLTPGLIAGWIYIVTVSIRELSSSVLLYSPGSEVISITIWEMWLNGQTVQVSALGVLFIVGLFVLVVSSNLVSRRLGVRAT